MEHVAPLPRGDGNNQAAQEQAQARRPRGRPRSEEASRAILDAMVALLGEHGFGGVTIDAVAARAGVGRMTIHRRWPTKSALLSDAVLHATERHFPIQDTGDFRRDLREALVRFVVDISTTPFGQVLLALVRESTQHDEWQDVLDALHTERRAQLARMVAAAVERGQLAPDTDAGLLVELVSGPLWTRILVSKRRVEPAFVDRLLDVVLPSFGWQPPTPTPTPAASPPPTRRRRRTP